MSCDCPVCHKPMKEVMISGVELDYCAEGCNGVWFDAYELKKLDEMHEGAGPVLDELLQASRKNDARPDKLECPKCDSAKLRRRRYSAGVPLEIDECYVCGGIWLDGGELLELRKNYRSPEERERIVEAMLSADPAFIKRKQELKLEQEKLSQKSRASMFSFLMR